MTLLTALKCFAFTGVGLAAANLAMAQSSQPSNPPDFAAVFGTQAEVQAVQSGHKMSQSDIDRQLRAESRKRTQAERQASLGFNRMIEAMPATRAQAAANPVRGVNGAEAVLTSRQEIEPVYLMPVGRHGGKATHNPDVDITQ